MKIKGITKEGGECTITLHNNEIVGQGSKNLNQKEFSAYKQAKLYIEADQDVDGALKILRDGGFEVFVISKSGKFQKGNQAAVKGGFEKKMRIRVPSELDFKEIERWLPDPESRGRALIAAAYERQSIWMDANMSDDLIDEYEESGTDLDPKEWFEKRTK